jgi:hypothetical protein
VPFFKQISLYATKIKGEDFQTPTTSKMLSSPKTLTKLAPVATIVKNSPRINPLNKEEQKFRQTTSKMGDLKGQKSPRSQDLNTEVVRLPNTVKKSQGKGNSTGVVRSPSLFLRSLSTELAGEQIYCECGNICEGTNTLCPNCLKAAETIEKSGVLSIKSKEGKIKKYFYKLLNKELYCIILC